MSSDFLMGFACGIGSIIALNVLFWIVVLWNYWMKERQGYRG